MDISTIERSAEQGRVVVALCDDQGVGVEAFFNDIPGVIRCVGDTSDAQSLALPNCVEDQTIVASHLPAGGIDDVTGTSGQVVLEEVPETALTDEADTG